MNESTKGATHVEKVYTTKQAAEYLGVHVQTIKNYVARGELKGVLLTDRMRVYEQHELDALVERTGGEFRRGRPPKRKSAPEDALQDDDSDGA